MSKTEISVDMNDGQVSKPSSDTTAVVDEEKYHLSGPVLWVLLAGLSLASFLSAIDTSIVATAIPKITVEFNSTNDIGWYGSAYLLTLCSLQPIAGQLYANFSLKWTFLSFFFLFEIGSLLCGIVSSSKMLIVARALAGAGSAGIPPGAFSIIACISPLEKRPAYIGIVAGIFGVAMIVGPLIGGAFTENVSWRWCFYINLPTGALTVAILIAFFRPPTRPAERRTIQERRKKLDLVGAALFIPSIVMVLLAIQWGGNEYAWGSATIIGLLCGFAALLSVFAWWQTEMGDDAMIPPRIMTQRTVLFGCVTGGFLLGGGFIGIYYLPEWFQVVKDVSPLQSGLMNIPLFISQAVGTIAAGVLTTKTGYYNPFVIIGTILAAIGTGLYTTFDLDSGQPAWIGYQVISGLGLGLGVQMPVVAVQTVLPSAQVPIGMAIATFFQLFGSAVFIAAAQAVFNNTLIQRVTDNVPSVSPTSLLHAGSAGIRSLVSPEDLPAILTAFNIAIRNAFYLALGVTVASVVTSLGMEWKNIMKKANDANVEEIGPETV